MIEAIGGRKVLIVAAAVLLGVGAVFLKGDVPPNFLALMQWAVGLFIVGNIGEHAAAAYATPDTAAPAADHSSDMDVIKLDMGSLKDELTALRGAADALGVNDNALANGVATIQQALATIIKRTGIDRMPDPK